MRSLSVLLLLEQVFYRLLAAEQGVSDFCLCRRIDSKPLPVGPFSKDRQARRGHAGSGRCKGYRIFASWGTGGVTPEAMVLGPMSESDPAGAGELIGQLDRLHGGRAGGYLLADATHDSNSLHEQAAGCGLQLLAPRRKPETQLGHREHSPHRLRSIELLEGSADPWVFALHDARGFGRSLYRHRGQIERDYGNLSGFGAGLQPLPSFVRRPRRVAFWVIGKLIVNGLRICRNKGLTP